MTPEKPAPDIGKRPLWFFIRCAVAAGLLAALVLLVFNREDSKRLLENVRAFHLVALVPLLCLFLFLGGLNIWILLRGLSQPVSLSSVLSAYHLSWAASLVLPARTGELGLLYFLKQKKIPLAASSTVFLTDKIITFFLYAVVPFFVWLPDSVNAIASRTGFAIFLLLGVVLLLSTIFFRSGRWANLARNFETFRRNGIGSLALNAAVTLIKIAVMGGIYTVAFLSFGMTVPYATVTALAILTTFVSFLPLSISGLGTVEAAAIFLFGRISVAPEIVLAVYLLLRLLNYGYALFLWLFLKP